MSDVYPGPARPSGTDLQEAQDRVREALRDGSEQEFGARAGELNATHAGRFMPDLGLMDVEAEAGIDPDEWYGEHDEPEAGQ